MMEKKFMPNFVNLTSNPMLTKYVIKDDTIALNAAHAMVELLESVDKVHLIDEIISLTNKYHDEIASVGSRTSNDSVNGITFSEGLYVLDQYKRKFFKDFVAIIVRGADLDIHSKVFASLDPTLSPHFCIQVLQEIADIFAKKNSFVLSGADKDWVQRKIRHIYQNLVDLRDSTLHGNKISPNYISSLKALFGIYYSFARDLETLLLQKESIYNICYNNNSVAIENEQDAQNFGNTLNYEIGEDHQITFATKEVNIIPPFKEVNVPNFFKSSYEKKMEEEKSQENPQESDQNGICITEKDLEELEEAEGLHSYLWFKKQMVMIVSSYLSLGTDVQLDKFNPIFERYVKILASTFRAPITESCKIQAGFKYLAEFAEEARKYIEPDPETSKE